MNLENFSHIILHLSLIPGIGPATVKLIVKNLSHDKLEVLYLYKVTNFVELGLSYDRAVKLVAGLQDRTLLEKELALLEQYKISWCVLGSSEYPTLLSEIEQPPVVLYYQGAHLFAHEKALAFVGSRKADAYARLMVNRLVPDLVQQDWIIVSGGALGVDTFVHDATVRAGGKTIVVLGSGLLHWYPTSNNGLFQKVIDAGGMIVSSFSLQTQPLAGNFPARNRIIAGLSQGTIVVQAAAKSGALITADFAVEQGRQVFAIPGSIEHGLHDGCHALIQQGAKLVTNSYDIMTEFGLKLAEMSLKDTQLAVPFAQKSADPVDKILLEKLLVATSTDDLLKICHVSLEDLLQKLFDLSLQGKISQDMMGLWKRI